MSFFKALKSLLKKPNSSCLPYNRKSTINSYRDSLKFIWYEPNSEVHSEHSAYSGQGSLNTPNTSAFMLSALKLNEKSLCWLVLLNTNGLTKEPTRCSRMPNVAMRIRPARAEPINSISTKRRHEIISLHGAARLPCPFEKTHFWIRESGVLVKKYYCIVLIQF